MTIMTLKERVNSYREAASQKLMRKIPLVVNVNGRAFSRATANLQKPFSTDLSNVMCATAIKLCHEIDGSIFAFGFSDDITIVIRNDQHHETMPWFQNDVQKIVSACSSIATLEFNSVARDMGLCLEGDATFCANVFGVPNLTEAMNVIISRQQLAGQSSLNFATYFELYKKIGKEALEIVRSRTLEEKEELLWQECGINYNEYSPAFQRGFACYRAPSLVGSYNKLLKNKWIVNTDIPLFAKDQSFLMNIFKTNGE